MWLTDFTGKIISDGDKIIIKFVCKAGVSVFYVAFIQFIFYV